MADWWEQYPVAGDAGGTATAEGGGNWWEQYAPADQPEPTPVVQPDPLAEQYAAAYQDILSRPKPLPFEPPADATDLERMTATRGRELFTGVPHDDTSDAARAAYENETDPEVKRQRLIDYQMAQRYADARREGLQKEREDITARGISIDQKILEERAAVEAGLGPDMALANAPIMRGAMTGVQNAASNIAETALRILPGEGAPSDLADKIGRQRASEGQRQAFLDEKQGNVAALPNAVTQMTGEYLPLSAVGVPAALQVGAKGMNDAYLQSDSDAYAITSGIVQGALTYAGGKLAGGTFIDMLGGKVAGKTLGPMLKGFGIESAEELGQLYGQALIDKGFGVGTGRMPTLKEAVWTLAVVAGSRGVGSVMSANIEDDGTKPAEPGTYTTKNGSTTTTQTVRPSMDQTIVATGKAMKEFVSSPWPSRKKAIDAGVQEVAKTARERKDLAADIRNRLTADQFTEQLRTAATSPEEADALLEIYKARAASAGETFDDYVGKRVKGVEKTTRESVSSLTGGQIRPDGRRGEIEFLQEGTAIIRAFETQSVGTLAHETGHLFRRDLSGPDLRIAEQWAGARKGKWNRKAEEKFARGFENYLATGKAPTKRLADVFAKFKDWLSGVYGAIKGTAIDVNISPEMRGVFDRLLTPAETASAEQRPEDAMPHTSNRPQDSAATGRPFAARVFRGVRGEQTPGTGTFYAFSPDTAMGYLPTTDPKKESLQNSDVSLRNPLVVDGGHSVAVFELLDKISDPVVREDLSSAYGVVRDATNDGDMSETGYRELDQIIAKIASSQGYDGIVYRKPSREVFGSVVDGSEVVVFEPRKPSAETPDILSQDLADRFRGLANRAVDQRSRDANYAVDQAMGVPEARARSVARSEADSRLAADPVGELQSFLNKIDEADRNNGTVNLSEADLNVMASLVEEAGKDISTPEARQLHAKLQRALRQSNTEAARRLGVRDPLGVMDPEARKRKSIVDAVTYTPSSDTAEAAAMEERYNVAKEKLAKQGIDLDDIDSIVADPKKAMVVLDNFRPKANWSDALFEYWRNSILSGPTTQVTNVAGNAAFGAWNLGPERAVEAAVNLFARDKRAASFGEFKYLLGGVMPGIVRGLKNARTSWSLETSALAEELGRDGAFKVDGPRGAIKGKMGRLVRAMGYRPLLAADEFAKSLVATMEVGARAYRNGKGLGLEGAELQSFIQQQTDDLGSASWSQAFAKAEELAFQGQRGLVAQTLAGGGHKLRKFKGARWVLPFVETPAAIFEQGIKRTPVLGAILDYAESRRTGMNMVDAGMTQTLARQIIAMGGLALLWDAVGGDEPWLTGGDPLADPKNRDVSYRARPAMSIRLGDQWYSYARIEPFATAIALTADSVKGIQNGKYYKPATGLIQQAKEKSYLDGLGDAIDAIQGAAEGDLSATEQWGSKFAASWVPNLYRQTVRAGEGEMPENRMWGKGADRFGRFVNRTAQQTQLPFIDSQPRFDIWGRPISYNDMGDNPATSFLFRVASPVKSKDLSTVEQADLALIRWNEKHPDDQEVYSEVQKFVTIGGETQYLTDEQHAQYAQLAGEESQAAVSQIVFDPLEPTAKDISRIKKAITDARKRAREALMPTWTFD